MLAVGTVTFAAASVLCAATPSAALADVPAERAGSASGIFINAQHVAGAVGIGVLGGLYTTSSGGRTR